MTGAEERAMVTVVGLDLTGTPRAWLVDDTALFLREFWHALMSTSMSTADRAATVPQLNEADQA